MKNLPILVLSVNTMLFAGPWDLTLDANLMVTLNTYSKNWAGGEAGSFSWTLNSNFSAEKQLSTKVNNKNTLKVAFGQTKNQDRTTKDWSDFVKSTDLTDFESVFRFTLGGFADPYTAGRIETQFIDQSDTTMDRILNPVKFTESFGIARVLLSDNKRESTVRLGVALIQKLNRDVLIIDNIRETKANNYGGIEFVTDFKTPLAKDQMSYITKLTVFEALIYSKASSLQGLPNENYWRYPDVNWENIFTANITNYLMVNFHFQILYDKETDKRTRIKQTLSLGLTYKIG